MASQSGSETDLSIIIVNFNTADLLRECLESIEKNRGEIHLEILVVDNNSGDLSVEMIGKDFPQVKMTANPENVGFARGVNQTLDQARGRYLLLLNPDAEVLPGTLRGMVDFMDRNKDAAIAGVQLLNPDGTKQNSIANFPSLTEQLFNKSLLRILFPKRYPSKYREFPSPIEVESVIGACMIVRFQAVQDVGKLDPGYFLFLEETDWCYQMKKKGWKIFHLPKLRALHKQGRSLVGFKSKGRIEYYRSLYRFFKKNYNRSSHLLLRVIVFTRTMVNLSLNMLAVIFTLGLKREFKEKVSICWHLFLWHLLGCPNREAQRYGSFFRI